jgi:hypothetical protein
MLDTEYIQKWMRAAEREQKNQLWMGKISHANNFFFITNIAIPNF